MNDIKKIIYLSHNYGGKESNKKHIEAVIKSLVKRYPDYTFLSPVHALGFLYDYISYENGMRHCLALLDMCDECWFIDGYNNSKGVTIEHEYCKEHRIPTVLIRDCNKCEYNDRIKCGVDFCMVPGCVKVKEGGGDEINRQATSMD